MESGEPSGPRECGRCHEVKPINEFGSVKGTPNRCCLECRRRDYAEKRANWTPEQIKRKREIAVVQYYKHRDRVRAYGAAYSRRPDIRERTNARKRERRANDIQYKLKSNVSAMIRVSLAKEIKAGHSIDLLGCTVEEFKAHIEAQFTEGMSWDLWSTDADGISLDHVLPCALFDMTKASQQRACFNYRNVRPMWHRDNIAKQDYLDDGRRAIDLTPDEKREHLISKGYGYLFDGSQDDTLPDPSKLPRPWRYKAVIRDDGKRYESIQDAEHEIGCKQGSIGAAIKRKGKTAGHYYVYAKDVEGRPLEEVLDEYYPKRRPASPHRAA